MVWNFNYCAPALPNDPTLQFNRNFQIGTLIAVLFFYILVHIYYYMFGPDPLEDKENNSSENGSPKLISQLGDKDKVSDQSSPQDSNNEYGNDENSSYLTFKNTKTSYKNLPKTLGQSNKALYKVVQNVTIKEVENFFPLIFGHFSIIVSQSTLYTPYFEQTLAILLYGVLCIILVLLNAKRMKIALRIIWSIMCLLILFVAISVLVQIAQTNYGSNENACFGNIYTNIY